MSKEYPLLKELESEALKNQLYIDCTSVSAEISHCAVLCVVSDKSGKRVIKAGEVCSGESNTPFIAAMNEAKLAALCAYYDRELPDSIAHHQSAVQKSQAEVQNSSVTIGSGTPGTTGGTNTQRGSSNTSGTGPVNNTQKATASANHDKVSPTVASERKATSTTTAGSGNSSAETKGQTPSQGTRGRTTPPASPAVGGRTSSPAAQNHTKQAPSSAPSVTRGQTITPITRQQEVEAAEQTSSDTSSPSNDLPDSATPNYTSDDFPVLIGPYEKKQPNNMAWIVENDLDFIRRINNLSAPTPIYAEVIAKIKDYIKSHGIVL